MFLYCFSWFWQDPMPRWAMLTARLVLKVTWVPWWRSLASKTMSSILRLELVLGEWGMRILNICWLSPYSTCLKNPFSARACPSRNTRSSTNSTSSLWHRCLLIWSSFYPARALRALGLLLADGAPTVGRGKTFWWVNYFFYENCCNSETESRKIDPKVGN